MAKVEDADAPEKSKRPRRGRGEGAIYQRTRTLAGGREVKYWTAAVRLEDGTRREFQGKTKKAVQDKLGAAQEKVRKGEQLDSTATVGDLLEKWLTVDAKPVVRASTFAAYRHYVDAHLAPGLGKVRLSQLKAERVQTFLNDKLADGLAPQTVRHLRAILRRALNVGMGWDLLSKNAVKFTKPPRVPKRKQRRLTPEQAKALLDACQAHRLGALYTVALSLGARQAQLLGLRWPDVDVEKRTINLEMALTRTDGEYVLSEPKNEASSHTLPLPEPLVAVFTAHRDRQAFEAKAADKLWKNGERDLVFTTVMGAPLNRHVVTHQFQKLLPVAGIPHMTFHDLRGSCATLLAVLGVHPRVAMEILGHADFATTMRYYTDALSESQWEAMAKMGGLLWGEAE